jgi:hypothetical protein
MTTFDQDMQLLVAFEAAMTRSPAPKNDFCTASARDVFSCNCRRCQSPRRPARTVPIQRKKLLRLLARPFRQAVLVGPNNHTGPSRFEHSPYRPPSTRKHPIDPLGWGPPHTAWWAGGSPPGPVWGNLGPAQPLCYTA